MLQPKQAKFVELLSRGNNITEASKILGYNRDYASRMLRKSNIAKALERAGLSDTILAQGIKTNFEAGMGVKATADTSLKATELALRLKGYLDKPEATNLTQNNVYINELKQLNDEDLSARLDNLTQEVQKLK